MGNTHTSNKLATAAVAQYMELSKHQVIQLHDACQQLSRPFSRTTFKRKHFKAALNQAQIDDEVDRDILRCLCVLWDLTGDGYVPYREFAVGLSPLACPGESISTVLSFALQLMDEKGTGEISAKEMIVMLKSLCATASYFGDELLSVRQIYKIVDNVFDTMTVVDDNGETISHKKAIMKLVREDAVRNLFAASSRRSLQNGKDDFSSDKDNSLIASSEEGKPKRRVTMKAAPFVKTRLEEETSSLIMPSDVSSVMLSPLVEVPVQSFATSEFTKSTLGIVLS